MYRSAPLLGHQLGWRSIFLLIAALSALGVAGLAYGLQRDLPRTTAGLTQRLTVAGRGPVLRALLITLLWSAGGFTLFPYLAIVFECSRSVPLAPASRCFCLDRPRRPVTSWAASSSIGLARPGQQACALAVFALVLHLDLARVKGRTCGVGSAHLAADGAMGRGSLGISPAQNAHLVKISPDAPMVALSLMLLPCISEWR